MLYRTPRFSVAALLRITAASLAGAVAELHRVGADTAHLGGLSDGHLRDLGLRRFDDQHFHQQFYR